MRWRIPAIFAGIIVLLVTGAIALTLLSKKPRLVPSAGIGGPFSLVDHRGKPVTEKDFRGKNLLDRVVYARKDELGLLPKKEAKNEAKN